MSAHKLKLLITGGAGYIGSHLLLALKHYQGSITVLDNLSTGHQDNLVHGDFVLGDLRDPNGLDKLFKQSSFDAVIHFAASTSVPESIVYPEHYFENNTLATFNLIKACLRHEVKHFMFSSTAAVYGVQPEGIVTEGHEPKPINPYGQSKWLAEQMLLACAQAHGMHTMILRYFNVAGVDPSCKVGPRTEKAPHLMKAVVDTALGKQNSLAIYGDHYGTPDGTGIRDYIHVNDLIQAHILALDFLCEHKKSMILNCGYGHGYSVKEVVDTSRQVFQTNFPTHVAPPRAGDCPKMIANPELLKKTLNWRPEWDDLALILKTQRDWELALSKKQQLTTTS